MNLLCISYSFGHRSMGVENIVHHMIGQWNMPLCELLDSNNEISFFKWLYDHMTGFLKKPRGLDVRLSLCLFKAKNLDIKEAEE